jgi:hypothetical protein
MRHEPNRDAKTRRFAPVRDAVVARQREDGSWSDEISPEYATASAVFVLGAPDSRLNVFREGNNGRNGKLKTD